MSLTRSLNPTANLQDTQNRNVLIDTIYMKSIKCKPSHSQIKVPGSSTEIIKDKKCKQGFQESDHSLPRDGCFTHFLIETF